MKTLKKVLPFLLTSILIIGFWKLWTWTDNYAFNPKGKDLLMLDIALTPIFFYKTIYWLIIGNLTVLTIRQLIKKYYKTTGILTIVILAFYFIIGQMSDKKCASHYYSVFINQSTKEDLLTRPIKEAGYYIGPILTEKIADREMKYRIYAIGGLKEIKYKPATSVLAKILIDKTEYIEFRAAAYEILSYFDTDETRKILNNYREQSDSIDNKVIELGNYFIKSK